MYADLIQGSGCAQLCRGLGMGRHFRHYLLLHYPR